jgi:hypothetical protein
MNCYTEIATVSAVELAQTIAPYAHLIPSGNVQFNAADDGNLVVELFNGVICWESAKAGTIAVKAEYLSTTIPGGEPALPAFVTTNTAPAPAKEKKTRNRRSNAQIAADQAAEADRLAAIAKAEAVLDADEEGGTVEANPLDEAIELAEELEIVGMEADEEEDATPIVTSEISTVSKRSNPFANAA